MTLNWATKFLSQNRVAALGFQKIHTYKHPYFENLSFSVWKNGRNRLEQKLKFLRKVNKQGYCTIINPQEQLLVRSYGEPLDVIYKEEYFLPKDLGKQQASILIT